MRLCAFLFPLNILKNESVGILSALPNSECLFHMHLTAEDNDIGLTCGCNP